MKNTITFFTIILTLLLAGCKSIDNNANSEISIIPKPMELKVNNGSFRLNEHTQIIYNSDTKKVKDLANYFVDQINLMSGYSLKLIEPSAGNDNYNSIELTDENVDSSLGDEGYTLYSNENKTTLTGSPTGLFYAVQTLFQLLPVEIYGSKAIEDIEWTIPAVVIRDKPRFKWRGMHLDVGRFMFPVPFIKKYIDFIAMHKMNTFHWHLTEDQGWRIEIKKYPLLTEIGAWRKGTTVPELNKPGVLDGKRYGGFYTQEEIKELVVYAQNRNITIIPEIEMPGHSIAALAAYPEFSCTGGPFEVRSAWSFSENIYCAGNDATFSFIEDVLTEVMELFPSEYIHIGGDEAPKTAWKKCSKCQLRIKNEGLNDEHDLQSYFITRIEKFVNSKERKIIGWDEIMQGGLAPNAAIMSWRGEKGGLEAAKQKHYAVMSPSQYCYFDLYQGKPEEEPRAMEGMVTLETAYSYEPIPRMLSKEDYKYILGVQGNVWTEFIRTPEQVEYMVFPRMSALAEVAWSPKEKRNLPDFLNRLDTHFGRLDELNVNYRWPRLEGVKSKNVFIDDFTVDFKSKRKDVEIRYTIDGTSPTKSSKLYTKPFKVSESKTINVTEFSKNGKNGHVYKVSYNKQIPLKSIVVANKKEGLKFDYYEFNHPIDYTLDLLKMKPIKNGIIENFIFPYPENKLPDSFGLIFNGFIEVPSEDIYTFSTKTNDGSRLYIDDQLIVENDGWHGPLEKRGEVALTSGNHRIKLLYFQSGGRKSLEVFMKNRVDKKNEIKENILTH